MISIVLQLYFVTMKIKFYLKIQYILGKFNTKVIFTYSTNIKNNIRKLRKLKTV